MDTRKWLILGLVTLNLVLGAGLYDRLVGDKPAFAQTARRSSYLFATGPTGIVLIFDTTNGFIVTFQAALAQGGKAQMVNRYNVGSDFERARAGQ